MYWLINFEFIPISSTGKDSEMKLISILTASSMISMILSFVNLFCKCLYRRQAKSVCMPSSLEISSFEKQRPGMIPRFLSQKIAQKEPEKKIPSIAAKAINRSAKHPLESIHLKAQLAFCLTEGMLSMALKRKDF